MRGCLGVIVALCVVLPGPGSGPALAAEAPAWPGDSIYQLQARLSDPSGRESGLDVFAGKPVLISMFYASCPNACPMLIAAIRQLERQLEPAERRQLRVLMISIDPERDTAARLAAVAGRHQVDAARWRLVRVAAHDVRRIAAVLGIAYRRTEDGEFYHASLVSLLDADGRIVATTNQPQRADEAFMSALRARTGTP